MDSAATCSTAVAFRHQFKSKMLLCWYGSLIMCLEKQWKIARVLRPVHLHEDLEEASGSWFWPGIAPAIVAIWEVNSEWKTFLSVSLSVSFSVPLPFKQINSSNKIIKLRKIIPIVIMGNGIHLYLWWIHKELSDAGSHYGVKPLPAN